MEQKRQKNQQKNWLMFFGLFWRRIKRWFFLGLVIGLGVVLYRLEHPGLSPFPGPGLEMTVFNVGQGDAILVEVSQRDQILIDGGPDDLILTRLGQAMPLDDRTIELLVLTHPHLDHLTGLISVFERYQVLKVIWPELASFTTEDHLFREAAKKEGSLIEIIKGIKEFKIAGVDFKIVAPLVGDQVKEPNDASLVMKITFGEQDILLMGDLEAGGEEALIRENLPLQSAVLKVGHHGSKSSSTVSFLEKVRPRYALISVGRNSYGHPHAEILRRLAALGSKIFRTDQDGDLIIRTDGQNLTVFNRK